MYKKSSHWKICDVCGFKTRAELTRKRWDGLIVCPEDYETDHPQKFIRVQPDGLPVQDPRPRPEDVFRYVCNIYANMAYADMAEADCAGGDNQTISYIRCLELKGTPA